MVRKKQKTIKTKNKTFPIDIERRSYLVDKRYKTLKKKTVALIGVGGTGNLLANLLARAGVGKLILIDKDNVEESNLERQMMFDFSDIKRSKSKVCNDKLSCFCNVTFYDFCLDEKNVSSFGLEKCDLIIDCTDNIESRFVINDFCKLKKIPFIYTGAIQNIGVAYFVKPKGPCLKCFLNKKSGSKAKEVGVINSCVTLVSSIAASMAYNYLVFGIIEEKLLRINLNNYSIDKISVRKDKRCCN